MDVLFIIIIPNQNFHANVVLRSMQKYNEGREGAKENMGKKLNIQLLI